MSKPLKRASADYGKVCKAMGSVLPISGCQITGVRMSNAQGSINLPEGEGTVFYWIVTVRPPEGNLYGGCDYDVLVNLSEDEYPFAAPVAVMKTRIFNPVVNPAGGKLCDGILKNADWKPTVSPVDMVDRICNAVFVEFGKLEALNTEAAQMIHEDRPAFEARARAVRDRDD